VAVVSGGVAGMAAAAERTCRHLFEKSLHLGGQLRLAGAPPGRDEFVVLAEDLSQRLIDLNVRVILTKPLTLSFWPKKSRIL
jgi:2,4-dienoyl-CoA reductase (NADPH2)